MNTVAVIDYGMGNLRSVCKAIGDKAGVRRYGHAYVPLDEALSRVVIDFSGRPGLEYHVKFTRALRMAAEADPRAAGAIPSTKGSL